MRHIKDLIRKSKIANFYKVKDLIRSNQCSLERVRSWVQCPLGACVLSNGKNEEVNNMGRNNILEYESIFEDEFKQLEFIIVRNVAYSLWLLVSIEFRGVPSMKFF